MEKGDGAGGGFIREELGESEAAVVVNGDVKIFQTRASNVIALAVAGYAMADALDAEGWVVLANILGANCDPRARLRPRRGSAPAT